MDEQTIKVLMVFNPVEIDGVKYIPIPYESLLRGEILIKFVAPKLPTPQELTGLALANPPKSISISIPEEIQRIYQDKDKMAQDVTDYLKEIARCWEYKNLSFQQSILKKAAKAKPALNGIVFAAYSKEGDAYLTELVKGNEAFIKQCWAETN